MSVVAINVGHYAVAIQQVPTLNLWTAKSLEFPLKKRPLLCCPWVLFSGRCLSTLATNETKEEDCSEQLQLRGGSGWKKGLSHVSPVLFSPVLPSQVSNFIIQQKFQQLLSLKGNAIMTSTGHVRRRNHFLRLKQLAT